MKSIYTILLTAACFALFFSCKHELQIPLSVTGPTPRDTLPVNSTMVCFISDVLPIFQTNCTKSGCHNADDHEKDYVFDNYDNIKKGIESKGFRYGKPIEDNEVYKFISTADPSKIMPPLCDIQLTSTQKNLIKKWIEEGYHNYDCNKPCNSNSTYSGAVKPLLEKYCTGCHSNCNPDGRIDLTSYDEVREFIYYPRMGENIIYGVITHTPGFKAMPVNSKLSDCQITQIKKWINDGCPNN